MDKAAQVMGLNIGLMDADTFYRKVGEFLEDDHLRVILLATGKLLDHAAGNGELREKLSAADLILPGDEAALGMCRGEGLEQEPVVVGYRSLIGVMEYLRKVRHTIYLVTQGEKEAQSIRDFFAYFECNVQILGEARKEETEDEAILNEINGLAPDILLVSLESPLQEEWMMEQRTKVNGRLCVGLGGIMRQIIAAHGSVPPIVRKLHLSKAYRWLVRNGLPIRERKDAPPDGAERREGEGERG